MQQEENQLNLDELRALFEKSADVQFQSYLFGIHQVSVGTCDAMVDGQLLSELVIPRLQKFAESMNGRPLEPQTIETELYLPGLERQVDKKEFIHLIYRGYALLFFGQSGLIYTVDITKRPNRQPEETKMEVPVRGPRDNFIEDVAVNIALIRKRLPTNSLNVEKLELGKRSKTTIALLYFEDIASKEILYGIKKQLKKVDTDIIFSGDLLLESVNRSAKLFPRFDYTGRPDKAVQALARGRFLVLVDGVAYAVILPVNLFLLVKSSEDNEAPIIPGSFERILRIFGMSIGLVLPAFWLALTTFHQNQLPLQLLATIVQANTGLPLPSSIEMIVMLIMFELFREAGLRLPSALGGTIGVVGGLIIGDAAIRAGITSPAMVVVIAISTIATFTLVNQSLIMSISILRICFILLTSFFGLFGLLLSVYFTLVYLANIRTFGVPYLNIATDLDFKEAGKALFRLPAKYYRDRPKSLDVTDQTRSGKADDRDD